MPAVVIWRTRQRVQFLPQTRTKRKSTAMRLGWGHDPQTLGPHCVNQWLVSHGAHPSVTLPLTPGVFWAGESGCSPLFDIWYFAWWVRVLIPLWLYLSMRYLGYSAWWVQVLTPLWLYLSMRYLGYSAWWVQVLTPLWLYLSMRYLGYSAWWVRVLIPLWLPLNALPGVFLPDGSGCSPLCDFASYCTTCSNGYFLSMFRSRCPGAQQSPWPVALVRRIHPIWFSPHSITLRVGR